ncbi:hypothetical protein BWQ96_07173 [Gracilariopsis chorda]|uniref:Uncharacterized protein n=1 Tax=Gracilariopsis chorda TaxID=448386 RepID=A0A2V3IM16_9FLOR|nr:hypothetical protein BWQ96_07173 [Gracilariopsis chorda]|eukprot:PXF43087.1 hypothetical protein BWQ96_07173 [Gracilariopsis chorda]
MFAITDTSPGSPLIQHRRIHSNFKEQPDKKQFGTPNSCTSAVTESPPVSQSATHCSLRHSRPHTRVRFDDTSTARSSGSVTPVPSRTTLSGHDTTPQKQIGSTPATSTSYIRNLQKSAVTPVVEKRSTLVQSESFGEHETVTLKSATDFFSSEKPRKSITDNVKPLPSRIPSSRRRTPGYARSTKASRRRSEMRSALFLQSQRKHNNTSKPTTEIDFTKTIPKSPEVLRRKFARTPKEVSPRRRTTFKAKPVPRYLTMPRPVVRPTAKSEAILHGLASSAPMPPVLAACKLSGTVPKPFKLASVELHEARMKKICAKRKAEQEEAERRRVLHPLALNREMLEGPTFVPCLDKKNLTMPVDLLPWAAERRERTLAYEAAQRARIEEMEAMKEIAQRQRELAEEERLREDYERKKFRPRPVPRSHYYPDTPPKRKAAIAVIRIKEDIARRMECEEEELESVFSALAVSQNLENFSTLKTPENLLSGNDPSSATSKTAEKVGIENAFSSERGRSKQVINTSKENTDSDSQVVPKNDSLKEGNAIEVGKENIIPVGEAKQKDRRRQGTQVVLGPMRLFNEIRNTLLGRY